MKKERAGRIVHLLDNPDLSDYVFLDDDGEIAEGSKFIVNANDSSQFFQVYFENGVLTNAIWPDGHIQPAVEGSGYMEYRDHGVLDNPVIVKGIESAARHSDGFAKQHFYKKGKPIKIREKNYDENGNEYWDVLYPDGRRTIERVE